MLCSSSAGPDAHLTAVPVRRGVRIHQGPAAAESASRLGAQAYTVGSHIVLGRRADAGGSTAERLIDHELTHVAQQRAGGMAVVQRKIEPADLPNDPASEIMADETYFDNDMVKVEFYGAEEAKILYKDGSSVLLGLVPDLIKPPVEGVDYRTPKSTHIGVNTTDPGKLRYIPRGQDTSHSLPAGAKMDFGQFIAAHAVDVTFRHDPASGRIVPSQVNSITAPLLCDTLRRAEAEYVKSTDELAKGMV